MCPKLSNRVAGEDQAVKSLTPAFAYWRPQTPQRNRSSMVAFGFVPYEYNVGLMPSCDAPMSLRGDGVSSQLVSRAEQNFHSKCRV